MAWSIVVALLSLASSINTEPDWASLYGHRGLLQISNESQHLYTLYEKNNCDVEPYDYPDWEYRSFSVQLRIEILPDTKNGDFSSVTDPTLIKRFPSLFVEKPGRRLCQRANLTVTNNDALILKTNFENVVLNTAMKEDHYA